MIERFINMERPYGEPAYSKQSEEISRLKNLLCSQLNCEGQECLEQLTNAYLRQENAVLRDAFTDGFWTAIELMLEFEKWRL